jgi:hypothetical protein
MTQQAERLAMAALVALMFVSHGGRVVGQSAITVPPTTGAASDHLAIPGGVTRLGTVKIARAVLADGRRLEAGTYRVRLSGETVRPVVGETPGTERWVEFLQGGEVRGRALAPVVSPAAVPMVTSRTSVPVPGRVRVQTLRSGEYLRLWFNYGGDQVLVYLPFASAAATRRGAAPHSS